jgi:hypothetical protein
MKVDYSIEYGHIYINQEIGEEHEKSISIMQKIKNLNRSSKISTIVLVDDYSPNKGDLDIEGYYGYLK